MVADMFPNLTLTTLWPYPVRLEPLMVTAQHEVHKKLGIDAIATSLNDDEVITHTDVFCNRWSHPENNFFTVMRLLRANYAFNRKRVAGERCFLVVGRCSNSEHTKHQTIGWMKKFHCLYGLCPGLSPPPPPPPRTAWSTFSKCMHAAQNEGRRGNSTLHDCKI